MTIIHIFRDAFKLVNVASVKSFSRSRWFFTLLLSSFPFSNLPLKAGYRCPAASGGLCKRERNSADTLCFCSCHCSSFPITLHLYYNSVRGGQQGCLRFGTLCLEEAKRAVTEVTARFFAAAGNPSACLGEMARFQQIQFSRQHHRCKSSMDFDSLQNREMRSFRESALSKVIPLTSGRDSAATAPMSTLLICSSSCVVNFTVNLLCRLIERLPLFGGETQQASTTGMLACCLTPPWDTLSRGLL